MTAKKVITLWKENQEKLWKIMIWWKKPQKKLTESLCVSVCRAAEFWSSYLVVWMINKYIYIYQSRFQGNCLYTTCASKSSQIYGIQGLLFVSATYSFFIYIYKTTLHFSFYYFTTLYNGPFYPYCRLSFIALVRPLGVQVIHILLLASYVIFIFLNNLLHLFIWWYIYLILTRNINIKNIHYLKIMTILKIHIY